jgi:hypothetical protein
LENESSDEGYAGITPNFPAKIIPIQVRISVIFWSHCVVYFPGRECLKEYLFCLLAPFSPYSRVQFGKHIPDDEYLIAQPGAYLSHVGDVDVGTFSMISSPCAFLVLFELDCVLLTSCLNFFGQFLGCDFDPSPATCCCAGFGCLRQKVSGSRDSVAFLNAGGTILFRDLKENETVVVDSRSVVAMAQSVTLGIRSNGRFCTCLFGGEGCCSTTLTGPGKIFMQVRCHAAASLGWPSYLLCGQIILHFMFFLHRV